VKRTARNTLIAVAATALLASAACSSSGGVEANSTATADPNTTGKLVVWLQIDAQTLWPNAVTAATDKFHQAFPKVAVDVQYQAWTDHLTKFDATAQSHTEPDVIEFGNSETAQYITAGALQELSGVKTTFDNSDEWLDGLTQSCAMDGKLYCVPYYGGDRAVTYRKDIFAEAGITAPPASWDELLADVQKIADKHQGDKNFSAFYMPGSYPYGGLPFVYDTGASIATSSGGKWTAHLSSPQAQAGLANWKKLIDAGYRGDRTITNLNSYTQLVNGTSAMFYDSSGQMAAVFGEKGKSELKDKIGTFPMPSPTNATGFLPPFMGGSDLAVPHSAKHANWSQAWIRAFTSSDVEKQFVNGGYLANAKSVVSDDPLRAAFSKELANTWFVPLAPNWAQVEKDKIINQMLVDIATGKPIPEATKAADDAINKDLNAES
jgi:N,N'-diacetylchitobiose transport system substrate-binding protein